jgi:ribosomal protein S24E
VKKLIPLFGLCLLALQGFGQVKTDKNARKAEKRQKIAAAIRQEEEGVLVFRKQSAFGAQLRTNGYGIFFELVRMKTPRWSNSYSIELTEIKHAKEEKSSNLNGAFNNSFIFGKINNFYAVKLGYGRQYIFGQKGNKNGVAVIGLAEAGLALGLLRPYYLDVQIANERRAVKYESDDSAYFLNTQANGAILGSSGIGKGWNEIKVKPGAYIKLGARFDFNKYNDKLQAIQIGVSLEAYGEKIPQMAYVKQEQLFFQGHIAFVFGGRK